MISESTAYNTLVCIAGTGVPYRYDQVYRTYDEPESERARIIGNGFDFTVKVPVPDRDSEVPVEGTAELRVLRLAYPEPRLVIRVRLTWITTGGGKHVSLAAYEITPVAAAKLATTEPALEDPEVGYDTLPEEEVLATAGAAIGATLGEAAGYGAEWIQTYPGDDADGWLELTDPDRATQEYHSAAILSAQQAEPELLCMLSDIDMGAVAPQEPGLILAWIQRQPEITPATA